jgi:hypothetical protein
MLLIWQYMNHTSYAHYIHHVHYVQLISDFERSHVSMSQYHGLIPLCCRKTKITPVEEVQTHSEDESNESSESPHQSAARKRNHKGLVCLRNSVVMMRTYCLSAETLDSILVADSCELNAYIMAT